MCIRDRRSPMKFVNVTFTELVLNAYLTEPITYKFTHPIFAKDGIICPPTTEFVLQKTAMGMYINDPTRDDILLPPNTSVSVFTPATAIHDHGTCTILGEGSPYSCCFTSRQLATACRAQKKGHWSFDTFVNGTVKMWINTFSQTLDVSQPLVTVYYEDAFLTGFEAIIGDQGLFTCDNIGWDVEVEPLA
eukprot:TRINITY_DN10184_c0_g1_i1.p1 TRINITY_DN10184_c0_g1~~TRINITY_DN10184_c0_g1_i1.p1  ORF type:complete len:190 (-),score=33.65 TRINITY_DN10184_c0_g1_i1:282-851(-)